MIKDQERQLKLEISKLAHQYILKSYDDVSFEAVNALSWKDFHKSNLWNSKFTVM